VSLHLYGKAHAALRRKMGHFTVIGADADDALRKAENGRGKLHWIDNRAMSRA
jgi:5-(carboxyamino)imidazole ribonucleotide synthase